MAETDRNESSANRPKRRRVSSFARFRAMTQRRSWAMVFTPQKMMESARTLAWVGPLTILIWVYAEREQIATPTISAQVHLAGNGLSITPEQGRVTLDLKGPQSGLDQVRNQLTSTSSGITVELNNSIGRGHQRINVVDRIQNLPIFRDSGISVTKSDPAEIEFDVDDSTDMQVNVQNPLDVPNLESTSRYEPRTVTVHGPRLVLQGLKDQNKLNVYASRSTIGALKPGHRELTVDISLPEKYSNVALQPSSVRAILDVRSADTTKVLDSVVIWVAGPQSVLDNYEVTNLKTSVANVTVSGPPDQLELLDKTPPHAVLTITDDDFGREQPKQLDYVLPPDVKVSQADQGRLISFRLVKRPPKGE